MSVNLTNKDLRLSVIPKFVTDSLIHIAKSLFSTSPDFCIVWSENNTVLRAAARTLHSKISVFPFSAVNNLSKALIRLSERKIRRAQNSYALRSPASGKKLRKSLLISKRLPNLTLHVSLGLAEKKNGKTDKLLLVLAMVGLGFIIYFAAVFVHEFVHYWALKQDGVEVPEFVLLGWREGVTSPNFNGGTAWVEPNSDYDKSFHVWWDKVWCPSCDRAMIEEKYGVGG